MRDDNVAYHKAYAFAVRIVTCCRSLDQKREYTLSRQLLKCGTSIGANLAEADAALTKADFSAKVSIAFKECKETQYWLNLLHDTGSLNDVQFQELFRLADELGRVLFSILKTTQRIGRSLNV